MAKSNPRLDGVVRDAIARVIDEDIADPRVNLVTITDVKVTPDRKYATVYYTIIDPSLVAGDRGGRGDRLPTAEEVADGLAAARPRIQALVGQRTRIRNTPELRFEPDPVAEQAGRIESLLRNLRQDG